MPTYEYECTHCGHNFELFQNIRDNSLDKCPKCGKGLRRLIGTGSGIIFKGSGFYATDYRKKAKTDTSKNQCSSCPRVKEGCPARPQANE